MTDLLRLITCYDCGWSRSCDKWLYERWAVALPEHGCLGPHDSAERLRRAGRMAGERGTAA